MNDDENHQAGASNLPGWYYLPACQSPSLSLSNSMFLTILREMQRNVEKKTTSGDVLNTMKLCKQHEMFN